MKTFWIWIIALVNATALSAQWTNDTYVNTNAASGAAGDMQSLGTSDGLTYVAFWHNIASPTNYEMRLQVLDADGNKTLGDLGILVNSVVPMSTFTVTFSMVLDNEDNLYLAFTGTGDGNLAYVHKIMTNGTQLWGANGVNVGTGFDVKVLPLSNGEAIVAWIPVNQGVMQKYDTSGNAVWPAEVTIMPFTTGNKTSAGEMSEYSNGDFCVIFHERAGFSPSSALKAMRYTTAGAEVWNNPSPLTEAVTTVFNRRYSIVNINDYIYVGYSGSAGSYFYSYLTRVLPNGGLSDFGTDGLDFSVQGNNMEMNTWIAHEPGSDYIWGVCTFANSSQDQVGEYVQKWNYNTGERMLGENAKVVFPISADYKVRQGALQLINDQPLFVISNGNSNGVFVVDLLAVYLDANGDFVWPEQTRPVCTNANAVKGRIGLCTPNSNTAVCTWTDNREGGEPFPYAQRIGLGCLAPIAAFTATQVSGLQYQFASNVSEGDFVDWTIDGVSLSGVAQWTYTFAAAGNYDVCFYLSNECGADTTCINLEVGPNAIIERNSLNELQLFPNPNANEPLTLNVELANASTVAYTMYSSTGEKIYERIEIRAAGKHLISIPANNLGAGHYYMRVAVGNEIRVLPIVIIE